MGILINFPDGSKIIYREEKIPLEFYNFIKTFIKIPIKENNFFVNDSHISEEN